MIGPAKFEELANQAAEESRSLLERMNIATSILFSRFLACAEAGDDHALANIGGRLNAMFRDYARLTGELREASSVTINNTLNIVASPEFVALQSGLLQIARIHPGARGDIIALLRGLDPKPAVGSGGLLASASGDRGARPETTVYGLPEPPGTPIIECEAVKVG
jgi:hypothetical protein